MDKIRWQREDGRERRFADVSTASSNKSDDWNQMNVSAHAGRIVVQINPRQDLEVWFKDIEMLAARRIE